MKARVLCLALALVAAPAVAQYLVRVPANVNLTPTVVAEPISVVLGAETLPPGLVGSPYSHDLTPLLSVTGGTGSYNLSEVSWSIAGNGALPSGLSVLNGVISGIPTTPQTANFTVEAAYQDANGQQNYSIRVTAPSEEGALTGDANFGVVNVGETVTRTLQYENTGDLISKGVYGLISNFQGVTLTSNTCGTQALPIEIAPGGTCSMTVSWNTNLSGALTGAVAQVHSAGGKRAEAHFSGSVTGFNAAGAWSTNYSSILAPTAQTTNYGTRTTNGTPLSKTYYLYNTGTSGAIAASFVLSGDVDQFQTVTVGRYSTLYGTSLCSATVSTSGTSVCAADSAPTGTYRNLKIEIRYAPRTTGTHTLTVTPVSANGAVMPDPLVLTGKGEFNPAAEWSSHYANVTAPLASYLNFGSRTPGSSDKKYVYLHNTGTHGPLALSFSATGDTSQFKIFSVNKFNNTAGSCGATSSGSAASTCTADDRFDGSKPSMQIYVEYAPTVVGNHSITITPKGENGTVAPAPIVFTGRGEFNPAGAWSYGAASVVEPTSADKNFGKRTVNGAKLSRNFYIHNTGTNGWLTMAFSLSGDTSQFRVVSVDKYKSPNFSGCGATVSAEAVTECTAADKYDSNNYSSIRVNVEYAPTVIGNHSLTITPIGSNSTVAPAPIVLTGQGEFNPAGVWSSNVSSDANFGTRVVNGTALSKNFFINNTGTNGWLSIAFEASGDTAQFKIIAVNKYKSPNTSSCGAVIGATNVSVCTVDDMLGGQYPAMRLTIQYAPTIAGSHSLTLTPIGANGTIAPTPITFTGFAQ